MLRGSKNKRNNEEDEEKKSFKPYFGRFPISTLHVNVELGLASAILGKVVFLYVTFV